MRLLGRRSGFRGAVVGVWLVLCAPVVAHAQGGLPHSVEVARLLRTARLSPELLGGARAAQLLESLAATRTFTTSSELVAALRDVDPELATAVQQLSESQRLTEPATLCTGAASDSISRLLGDTLGLGGPPISADWVLSAHGIDVEPGLVTLSGPQVSDAIQLGDEAGVLVKTCGKNSTCIARGLEALREDPRWRKVLNRTCLGRHPDAFSNLVFNWSVEIGGLSSAWAMGAGTKEYPSELVSTLVIMLAVWAEQACRNEMEGMVESAPVDVGPTSWSSRMGDGAKKFASNSGGYLRTVPVYIGVYTMVSTGGDAIRGKDIDAQVVIGHIKRGAIAAAVDWAWTRNIASGFMDKLDLFLWPRLRRGTHGLVDAGLARFGVGGASSGAGTILRYVPGYGVELGARTAVRAGEGTVFLYVLNQFGLEDPEAAPDEATSSFESPPASVPDTLIGAPELPEVHHPEGEDVPTIFTPPAAVQPPPPDDWMEWPGGI